MSFLKKLLAGFAGLVALLVLIGFVLPASVHVERSIVIAAPQATVFTVLNGFRNFNRWSPWADLDPEARYTYAGPALGVGARMAWEGKPEVGAGSQEITASQPFERVNVALAFDGWEGTKSRSTYTLDPVAGGTEVSWSFDGEFGFNLLARYFGLLMDGFIGADYEKGLGRLKEFVEQLPKGDFSGLDIALVDAEAVGIAYVSTSSSDDGRSIGIALGVAYGKIQGFINSHGLVQVAPPLALYQPAANNVVRFDAAIPVDRTDELPQGDVKLGRTFGGKALRAVHRGSYGNLQAAHDGIKAYLAATALEAEGPVLEQYMNDPGSTPEADLVTHVYYPLK